jgi:hypothetical protein
MEKQSNEQTSQSEVATDSRQGSAFGGKSMRFAPGDSPFGPLFEGANRGFEELGHIKGVTSAMRLIRAQQLEEITFGRAPVRDEQDDGTFVDVRTLALRYPGLSQGALRKQLGELRNDPSKFHQIGEGHQGSRPQYVYSTSAARAIAERMMQKRRKE